MIYERTESDLHRTMAVIPGNRSGAEYIFTISGRISSAEAKYHRAKTIIFAEGEPRVGDKRVSVVK